MLPGESKYLPILAQELKEQFEYSIASLNEGVDITKGPIRFRKQFHPTVQLSAVGLHVLMCRRFRQVIALCQLGQVDSAEAVCRSMFEGLLTQRFICINNVSLRHQNGKKAKTFGKPLTQLFRAKLYVAHDVVQWKKKLDKMAKTPRYKRYAARELKKQSDEHDKWCREVGSGWAKALLQNTCAGLSIRELAYSLGKHFDGWYCVLYAIQSGYVHGGKFDISLDFSRSGKPPLLKWSDSPEEVIRALRTANYLYGLQQNEFNRLLNKEHSPYVEAGLFRNAISDLRQVFPF